MKRVLSFILTVCLLATITPFSFAVSAETEGNFVYEVANGEACITDVVDMYVSGTVTVPATLGGYPVTGIDSSAFQSCRQMTGIIIPEGITYIGNQAFAYCTSLESINFPASAEYIGDSVLMGCTALESITVAEGNPVYHSAGNCLIEDEYKTLISGCKASVIPADGSVEKLAYQSFRYIEGLTSIVIPDSVTEISSYVFNSCSSLESIELSKNLTVLGNGAFGNCRKLKSVTIPDGVKRIGYETFYYCTTLESVTLSANTESIERSAFNNCTYLETITIPESVTSIGERAFGSTGLIEVIFEKTDDWYAGETKIPMEDLENTETAAEYITRTYAGSKWELQNDDFAFIYEIYDGEAIITGVQEWVAGEVVIPAEIEGYPVTTVVGTAFYGNSLITGITFHEAVTYIGNGICRGCPNIESLTVAEENPVYHSDGNCIIETETKTLVAGSNVSVIPADGSVTSIGSYAFYEMHFESITLPESITVIEDEAFYGCYNLKSIELPKSLKTIGGWAFFNCISLESIHIPSSVISIGTQAFSACISLESLTVDEENTEFHSAGNCIIVTYSGKLIVACDSSVIPADGSIKSIGESAFSNYTKKSITIPEGVKRIGFSAFSSCENLESVSLPSTLEYIDGYAFYYCTKLESVNIPAGVAYIGGSAFSGCQSLKTAYFENPENWRIEYEDTVLEGLDDPETAAQYLTDDFVYEGFEKIVLYSYRVEDGEAVITEADRSLSGDVTVPAELDGYLVTGIYYGAFAWDEKITSITLPDSITYIGDQAFAYCTSLESINFPASAEYIGDSVLMGCTSLESITVEAGNPVYHSAGNCLIETESKTLVVGCNKSVIPADGSVEIIGEEAFYACEQIESITIPDGVTDIGYGAFMECTSIKSLHIPASVEYIGEVIAVYCSSLESITVDEANTAYHSAGNCLIETETGTIVAGCNASVIPADGSIKSIGMGAFAKCEAFRDITLPEGIESIGYASFSECLNLKNITLPKSLTFIDGGAFAECTALTGIKIPEGVTEIGEEVFYGCTSLESITIPAGITKISADAFSYCINLTKAFFENPEGWFYNGQDVSEALADPESAAQGLTNMYYDLVKYEAGNVDGEDGITASDAIYLLYHVFFGEGRYPVNQTCDFDGNGEVEAADAIYLLYHVFFGEDRYPLS